MPDSESKPPTLDYQPVTKSHRRMPTWLLVFLVGFVVGVVWLPAITGYLGIRRRSMSDWAHISVCPGMIVGDLAYNGSDLSKVAAWGSACCTVGVSFGLLALLRYAVYRGLWGWRGGKVVVQTMAAKVEEKA